MRKEEPVDYPDHFWSIHTTITCPSCNTTFSSDITYDNMTRKYDADIGTEMNFIVCPNCGYEGIVLW